MQEEPQQEHFSPEKIDEQIGRLQQEANGMSSEERLVRDLGRAYHEDVEEEQAIERIGQRLAIHAVQKSFLSDRQATPFTTFTSEFQGRNERNRMHRQVEKSAGSHVWVRRWGTLAATAMAILVVGSLLIALQMARGSNSGNVANKGPGNQSNNGAVTQTSPGMYVGVGNQLVKIDMQTRKVLWRFAMKREPDSHMSPQESLMVGKSLLVVGQTVYFPATDGRLYGLDAQTGKQLWVRSFSPYIGQLVSANGLLYVNTLEDGNSQTYDHVYALNPNDGTTKKDYHLSGAIASISNGVLYLSDVKQLTAVNLADGSQLWQTPISATQVWEQSIVIKNGIIYASSRYSVGQKTVNEPQDSYVYALDQHSGKITWTSEMMNGLVFNIAVGDDGRVYCGAQNHYVYAFDPQSKTSQALWKYHTIVGHVYPAPIVQGGVVYVGQSSAGSNTGNDDHLVALDAATGAQKWATPLIGYTGIGDNSPLVLNNGVIYLAAGRSGGVQGFAINNGKQVFSIPNNVLFSKKDADGNAFMMEIIITIVP